MIGKFFKFIAIGFLALIGVVVAFSLIGIVVGLAIKVAVLGAIGFGVYKLLGGGKSKRATPEISAEDRKWLES